MPQDDNDGANRMMKLYRLEMSYAVQTELEALTVKDMPFAGSHGSGSDYARAGFATAGGDSIGSVEIDGDPVGSPSPTEPSMPLLRRWRRIIIGCFDRQRHTSL